MTAEVVIGPRTTNYCFHARICTRFHSSSHLGFATGASVLGLLVDFNFLHHFLEGGAIMGPVVNQDLDLLGVFSHVATNWVRA